MNEGHQPRDRQVRTRIAPPATAQTIAPAAPVAAGGVATAPAAQGPARSGQDVYRDLIRQMADAEPAEPRQRSPRTRDRRPLAVQRAEQDAAMAPAGNGREIAMAKRDKTIPRTKSVEVAASSSSKPPPRPSAGAVKKAEQFSIAKRPRPQTATRPLVQQPQISGAKRKAEEDGGVRGRPRQPPAPSSARGTKREGIAMIRPGRPSQPAGPSLDDMQMPKAKKVDTPPRRMNQKKSTKVQWTQPRTNTQMVKGGHALRRPESYVL